MLKLEFMKWFHVKDNKINFFIKIIKFVKWFGGENLGASP
jgi:hypothetical protein